MSTPASTSAIPLTAAPLYAGFWRRVAAVLLDGLILFIPQLIVEQILSDRMLQLLGITMIAGAYYAGFHSSGWQATPGKRLFGIKVTDLAGGRISLGLAIGRFFATFLSSLILGIGFIMAAFTAKRQALHDMICGTLVVNRNADPDEVVAGGGVMRLTAVVWVVMIVSFALPVLAGIAFPASRDYKLRVKVNEVIGAAKPLKDEVERAVAEKRRWTEGAVPIGSTYASGAVVTPDGHVVVSLSDDVVRGGRLRFTPSMMSGVVQWKCTREDIPAQLVPASCRE